MGKEVLEMSTDEESDCVLIGSSAINNSIKDGGLRVSEDKNDIPNTPDFSKVAESDDCCDNESHHKEQELLCIKTSSLDVSLSDERANNGSSKQNSHQKSVAHIKSASRSSQSGNGCSRTTQQPFSLTTDNHGTGTRASSGVAVARSGNKPAAATAHYPNRLKKTQANSPLMTREASQLNTKHPDEEDASSVSSSTTSTIKIAKVKTTVPCAPVFRSSERVEKRKEFYSKLEEKHQALEAERSQTEARTKEERDAALKQLRKSLMFKANPIPSFYHEGPPAKVELKKTPPTRPKSPKFARRKSCNDAAAKVPENTSAGTCCGRMNRHSLGSCKDESCKLKPNVKITNAASREKEKSATESKESVPVEASIDQRIDDITVQ